MEAMQARETRHVLRAVLSLLVTIAMLGLASTSWARPSQSLSDPRPRGWVLDTTGTLSAAARDRLEEIASTVRSSGRGEVMVVVTDSVDGEVPRTYATRLFNAWKIGSAQKNDGVLVFAALSDRKSEIVLGNGVSSSAQVKESESIMQGAMLPHFKDNDPNGAMVAGAEGCAARILGVTLQSSAGMANEGGWLDDNLGLTLFGGGGLLCGLLVFGRVAMRRRPRKCSRCGAAMARLGEVEDDAHLTSGEQVEEKVGSVDYDVWWCTCGATEKLRYGAIFTRYAKCARCQAKTTTKVTTTVQHATEHSEGLARVDEDCVHCGYHNSYSRSIPRVTPSDSSCSGGSSYDSGSSGGSSSGSGASGSW